MEARLPGVLGNRIMSDLIFGVSLALLGIGMTFGPLWWWRLHNPPRPSPKNPLSRRIDDIQARWEADLAACEAIKARDDLTLEQKRDAVARILLGGTRWVDAQGNPDFGPRLDLDGSWNEAKYPSSRYGYTGPYRRQR